MSRVEELFLTQEQDYETEKTMYEKHANLRDIQILREISQLSDQELQEWCRSHPTEEALLAANDEREQQIDIREKLGSRDPRVSQLNEEMHTTARAIRRLKGAADRESLAEGLELRSEVRINQTRLRSAEHLYIKKKWKL